MSVIEKSAPLRIAIIGAGYVSRHHIRALKQLDFVSIVGLADQQLDAAQSLAVSSSIALACTTLEELLVLAPDCVFVLTPPSSHAALAIQALDAGCHVFVEKPMAESSDECQAMMAAASRNQRVLSVNHSDLFDPVVEKALKLVEQGACGDLLSVDINRSSEYPPYEGGPLPAMVRKGSYPFQDLGVHALYQIEAFLGRIDRLQIDFQGTGRLPNLRFDEWLVTAHCERGVGRVRLSWNARPMVNQLIVQGTRGAIDIDKFLQTCTRSRLLPGPKFVGMVVSGVSNSLLKAVRIVATVLRFATGQLKSSPGIVAGAIAFVRSVREQREPPIQAVDGARIVTLMESASRDADAIWDRERAERYAPLEPIKNLVTGAAGFVGRALVLRLLEEGESVRVLLRKPTSVLPVHARMQVVLGDLGDPDIVAHAVQGVERVFHVGAAMKGWREDFQSGTIWGTRNVLDACRKYGVKRLVHLSSMSVIDHAGNNPLVALHEDARFEPFPERRGFYTQTKLQAEQMVQAAITQGTVNAVILRPGQIFGRGVEKVAPNGVIALAGRWIVVGKGDLALPLVYLDDVIDGLVAAGARDEALGQTIHLVDTERITQREYITALAGLGSAAPKAFYWPQQVMILIARAVETLGKLLGREVPLTRYRIESIRPLSNFDVRKATRLLGWTPRVGVREGLQRMIHPPVARSSSPPAVP